MGSMKWTIGHRAAGSEFRDLIYVSVRTLALWLILVMCSASSQNTVYVDGCYVPPDRAGYGVFWAKGDPKNRAIKLQMPQTNLTAEIAAAVTAIDQAISYRMNQVCIVTDCDAVVDYWTGKRNVPEPGDEPLRSWVLKLLAFKGKSLNVTWRIVEAHSGDEGNKQADLLAKQGAGLA
ncbi:unnamed protein product [Dicrocoelium dendriticum]|nr:unnamed protein product [Dicrocoelium dendriticum]